jgi:hypothetical protein
LLEENDMTIRNSQTYDNLMLLKDATAQTATGPAQVGGSNRVLDVGPADLGDAKCVVDISALTGTGVTLELEVQGSVDAAFTVPVRLGDVKPAATGRAEVYFSNNQAGTIYRWLRLFVTLGGTTPSLAAVAYLTKE